MTSRGFPEDSARGAAGSQLPPLSGRRTFFLRLAELAAAVVGILMAIPIVRFVFYPLFAQKSQEQWSDLGPISGFAASSPPLLRLIRLETRDGWIESESDKAVYVTKDKRGEIQVLTAVCPHLGCTVQWNATKNEFHCPCHQSVFAPDGTRLAGPAPRSMDSLPIQTANGELRVRYEDFRQLLPDKQVVG